MVLAGRPAMSTVTAIGRAYGEIKSIHIRVIRLTDLGLYDDAFLGRVVRL
jgi:hypothetical protein